MIDNTNHPVSQEQLAKTNATVLKLCEFADDLDNRLQAVEHAVGVLDQRQVKTSSHHNAILKTLRNAIEELRQLKHTQMDEPEDTDSEWWLNGGSPRWDQSDE